jgi:acyl-CoA thioesterase-1
MRLFVLFVLLVVSSVASAAATAAVHGPILVLGDSLSAAHNIPVESGWVALLARRLQQPDSKFPYAVVNASISGETTAGGLARLPQLLAEHHPGLVLIELGSNDGLRGTTLAEIKANLQRMIKDCRAAGAGVVLVGVELPVNYGPKYRDGLREIYRDAAAEFNVPLVPFLLDGVALDPELMQDDGLHPRAAAEPKVLANIWPALQQGLESRAKD